MTAVELWGAAYLTAGLSARLSHLHALDAREYVGRHHKP
jgi:hypothetical protein